MHSVVRARKVGNVQHFRFNTPGRDAFKRYVPFQILRLSNHFFYAIILTVNAKDSSISHHRTHVPIDHLLDFGVYSGESSLATRTNLNPWCDAQIATNANNQILRDLFEDRSQSLQGDN